MKDGGLRLTAHGVPVTTASVSRALVMVLVLSVGVPVTLVTLAGQEPGAEFMPIVMMVGCVEDDGRGGFLLTDATDPVALDDRLPDEPESSAPLGDGRVRLIGTLDEFGVAHHAGHKVRVRGLHVSDEGGDEARLNLTSILMLAAACE